MQKLVAVWIILSMDISNGYGVQDEQQTSLVASSASKLTEMTKGSAVVKIIEMLGDMKAKTKADIDEETASMEEFVQYCSDGSKEKGFSIKTAARSIVDNTAVIDKSKATISELDDEIEELGTVVSKKETELEEATAIREEEQKDFKAVEADLMQTIKQLNGAIAAIKKGEASFIQGRGKKAQKRLAELTIALSTVIQSVKLTGEQKKSLKSFLSMQSSNAEQESDDLSLSKSLHGAKAHTAGSGGILDIIGETKDKAEGELSEARKAEMEASHKFAMLKQNLENTIGTKKKRTADAQSEKAAAQDAMGKADGELAEATKMKEDDEEVLKTLQADCQQKAIEWEHRLVDAKNEIEALTKAQDILQKGAADAFLQVSVRRVVRSHRSTSYEDSSNDDDGDEDESMEEKEEERRRKALQRIRLLQRSYHSNSLAQLESRMRSDPMAKIKGLIEEMIAKLMAEQEAEAGQKAFCDEEMGKSNTAIKEKTLTLDKLQSRIDKASARNAELAQAVKDLEAEVADLDATTAEATKIRNAEHETYVKASKDFGDAATATERAIKVLKDFYDNASLIQTSAMTKVAKASAPEFGGSKTGAGEVIISILEMSNEDFVKLHSECESTEEEAQETFEKLMNDNKASKGAKQAEVKSSLSR